MQPVSLFTLRHRLIAHFNSFAFLGILTGLTKLCDANNAGIRHAHNCTLILIERDSAKSLAATGLGVVGRDNFGLFLLWGNLHNHDVREAKHEERGDPEYQYSKECKDVASLRYKMEQLCFFLWVLCEQRAN